MLLALHLSRIAGSGPRPHHRRVAAAVLGDAAARGNGQLFALSNGDLALMFRPADGGAGVVGTLGRLFQADVTDLAGLHSLWPLPVAAAAATAYIGARVTERDVAAPGPDPQTSAGMIAAMDHLAQTAPLADLMHRQTAIHLRPGQAAPIIPLYREVAISTAVLEARLVAVGQANADPFLFNHLAARLDHRMLTALLQDLPGGPLCGGLGPAALHINMTLAGIRSEAFGTLASACQTGGTAGGLSPKLGVELQFVEIVGDPKAFVLARQRLRAAGIALVIDGINHHALALATLAPLEPDLVKLTWVAAMASAGPETQEPLRTAIERLGPERLVLQHADSEAALAWGLKHGIFRFQGRYIDALLAAERLRACPRAAACTLPQCRERASATGLATRAGCGNTALLDRAA